jgi:hypothetical protein
MDVKAMTKVIATASEMSNLVGMYGFLVVEKKIVERVFIKGKASNEYFISQQISPLTGEPNVAHLATLKELSRYNFAPTQDLANEMLEDYYNSSNTWRY